MKLRTLGELLKEAGRDWSNDNAPRMGAALAFYATFAIAPLLVICTAIAGLWFEQGAARGQLLSTARDVIGAEGARALEAMLVNAFKPQVGIWATIVGVATMIVAALGFFGELQAALNVIWQVRPRPDAGWWEYLRARLLSALMVLISAIVVFGMLVLSTVLAALGSHLSIFEPIARTLVMLVVMTLMFAMIYRVLPDAKIAWRDTWLGAAMTAILFSAGNYAIGLYLGRSAIGSAYGAAGSLAVLLAWFYYASQVFLMGAEITQAYAQRRHGAVVPMAHAEKAPEPVQEAAA